jgi:hypothetical protein
LRFALPFSTTVFQPSPSKVGDDLLWNISPEHILLHHFPPGNILRPDANGPRLEQLTPARLDFQDSEEVRVRDLAGEIANQLGARV